MCYTVADLEEGRVGSAPPLGRRTNAVTVLLTTENGTGIMAVSYTHLTLPTNREV